MAGPVRTRPAGRGFVITGIVLMALAVAGVAITVGLFGGRMDLDAFTRDVAVTGADESGVPGQIGFRVLESLASGDDAMTVGVVTPGDPAALDCDIVVVEGEAVPVRRGGGTDTIVGAGADPGWDIVVLAPKLPPGEYSARCAPAADGDPGDAAPGGSETVPRGEPSEPTGERFAVTRVVTVSEVFDLAGPAFGVLAAIVLGGLLGVLGLVLLIVGLVVGNRARRATETPWDPPAPGA